MNNPKTLIEGIKKHHNNNDKGVYFIEGQTDERYITYQDVYTKSMGILHNLQSTGLKPGDELVFLIDSNEDFILVFWACIIGGIIPVPIMPSDSNEHKLKLIRIWTILNNPYLISNDISLFKTVNFEGEENLSKVVDDIRNKHIPIEKIKDISAQGTVFDAQPDTIAFIQFSSGSTGDPKGVVLTHENLLTNASAIAHALQLISDDIALSWMPLTHDMGLIGFHIVPLLYNVTHFLLSTIQFIFNPVLWINKASEHKVTITSSPNFGYTYFLKFYHKDGADESVKQWDLSSIRAILNGAEPISIAVVKAFQKAMEHYKLNNNVILCVYGLAEASLAVSFPPLNKPMKSLMVDRAKLSVGDHIKELVDNPDPNGLVLADLGYAINDCNIKIVDQNNSPLPDKSVGSILIKGKNVTKGYYNNPEKTKQTLSTDGWLNTGDLGFISEGRLFVTGRMKDLLFLNGQNYYAHDVERIIYESKSLNRSITAACASFNTELGRDEILIFMVRKKSLEDFIIVADKIKKFVSKQIGLAVDHVIPIKRLPKTTSGKLQRFKLSERYQNGEFTKDLEKLSDFTKGVDATDNQIIRNEIEDTMLSIWKIALEVNRISVDDNFFELGGNSLKGSLIISRIHKQLHVKIPIAVFFEKQTIRELADYIKNIERSEYIDINPAANKKYYNLSAAQKRFFVINQMNPNDLRYNLPFFLDIKGKLDIHRVTQIFKHLIQRHESLRTSFEIIKGEPVQIINENVKFECEFIKGNEDRIDFHITSFIRRFDLNTAPLIRVGILRVSSHRYILMIDMHHIITDGTSMIILSNEFLRLYQDKKLEPMKVQYKDYSEWQTKLMDTDFLKKQEKYWLKVFKEDIPSLNLPTDYPRSDIKSFRGHAINYVFSKELSARIRRFVKENQITLNILLLATYTILLSKYTDKEDIVVGSLTTGRNHIDLQNTVGLFFNTLAIRNKPKGKMNFMEFLGEVKNNVALAIENQDYQFNDLVWKLGITSEFGKNPLFDTLFTMQTFTIPNLHIENLTITTYENKNYSSKFDVYFDAFEHRDTIEIVMKYLTELYKHSTIELFLQHYEEIIKHILADNNIKLEDIILSQDAIEISSNNYREDQTDFAFK